MCTRDFLDGGKFMMAIPDSGRGMGGGGPFISIGMVITVGFCIGGGR